MRRRGEKKQRSPLGNLIELVATIAVAVAIAFALQAFVVKPYKIPSGSMLPTLQINQRILVNRLSTSPGIGDIVVFHPPAGADNEADPTCGDPDEGTGHPQACDMPTPSESSQTFVKRVVGLPGDRLRIVDGHVFRNGVQEQAPYAQPCPGDQSGCTFNKVIVVPPGHYFMMGDNRGFSDDSRFWGPVPKGWIIGTAFFTYWPIGRIGTI